MTIPEPTNRGSTERTSRQSQRTKTTAIVTAVHEQTGRDTTDSFPDGPRVDVVEAATGVPHLARPIKQEVEGAVVALAEDTPVYIEEYDHAGVVVTGIRYTEDTPAPLVATNEWRRRLGEMTLETTEDADGRDVWRMIHQPEDGQGLNAGYIVRDDGSIEHVSAANTGACYKPDGSYYRSGMGSYLASGTTGTGGPAPTDTTTPTGTTTTPTDPPLGQNEPEWDGLLADEFGGTTTSSSAVETSAVDGLNTDIWSPGYGWGRETEAAAGSVADSEISISNNTLSLTASHDADGSNIVTGAINTNGNQAFGPGHYFEVRMQVPSRAGFLPTFWSRPTSEVWPPQLDIATIRGNDTTTATHPIQYVPNGGDPGGENAEWCDGCEIDAGTDLSSDFHVYGCEWDEQLIRFYFDGEAIYEVTDQAVLDSLAKGAPFYMTLNLYVNKANSGAGTADTSVSWPEEMLVDYVRVWEATGTAVSRDPQS